MSPETPENPQQGKVGDTSPEDAAEAKQEVARKSAEQPEPSVTEGGTPSAEGAAAETTGVDKPAADALAAAGDEEPPAAPGDDDAAHGGDEEPLAAPGDDDAAHGGDEEPVDEEPPAE